MAKVAQKRKRVNVIGFDSNFNVEAVLLNRQAKGIELFFCFSKKNKKHIDCLKMSTYWWEIWWVTKASVILRTIHSGIQRNWKTLKNIQHFFKKMQMECCVSLTTQPRENEKSHFNEETKYMLPSCYWRVVRSTAVLSDITKEMSDFLKLLLAQHVTTYFCMAFHAAKKRELW